MMKRKLTNLILLGFVSFAIILASSCTNTDSSNENTQDAVQTEETSSSEPSTGNEEKIESHEGHEHGDATAMTYQCPMKCEGDKTYEQAGKCPKCGMDLAEVKN